MVGSLSGERLRRWVPVPIRVIIGVGFMAHGWAKWSRGPDTFAELLRQVGVPLPLANAWLVYGFSAVKTIGLTPAGPQFGDPALGALIREQVERRFSARSRSWKPELEGVQGTFINRSAYIPRFSAA
jgi:DoxX